jgi:hypothetical protein
MLKLAVIIESGASRGPGRDDGTREPIAPSRVKDPGVPTREAGSQSPF